MLKYNKRFISTLLKVVRYRHTIKIYFYQLLCVDHTHYEIKDSLSKVAVSQHTKLINFPKITAYGSSSVISKVNIIEIQNSISRHLLKVTNSHIVGPYGLLLNKNRQLLTHRIGGTSRVALQSPQLIWRSVFATFAKPQSHYKTVYTTHCTNSSNYFHWLLEFIAGLIAYEKLIEMGDQEVPILLQAPYMNRQKRWLDLVGYPYEEIKGGWNTHITAEQVYFSSNEFDTYCNIDKATCQWIRTKILRNAEIQSFAKESPKKLYINRADTNKNRGISNNQEIEAELIKLGYASITISDYSVDQQVALFHFADVIVGEHGAGLANVVFCDDCHIVEIFPNNYHNNDIAVLALHTNNSYAPLFGYSESHQQYPNKANFNDIMLALQSTNNLI